MGPFEVTKELVAQLGDEQLRKLLERLLIAEANARGIPHIGISVGGNQTAGDGGVDASISWAGDPSPSGWLQRQLAYFQCKAESMGPAKLRKEMRPDDQPRAIFTELAAIGGAYVVFSTDDPSKSAMDSRLAALREAVHDVDGADRIHLDFYGADRIARWANLHPGVAIWLLQQNGRALGGWRPYGDWSAKGAANQPYIVDDKARAAFGDELIDMRSAIANIRAALREPGGVVRLVGLSGMGKTRLAEALFDERLGEGALPRAKAIYGDAGRELDVGAARVAEELMLAGADAILVVDNANVVIHGQLAEIARRPGSHISVLTIDYDMGGEKPTGLLVALGENSELVLTSLLEQRAPALSEAECRHLAEFSGGNARIALKIAESADKGVDLSMLNDGELLERLFQSGRQERDPSARACADAAALVYAFYVEAGDHQMAEHPVLAAIAGVNVDTFFRNVATFLEWGVVQQRGPQRAMMPPPFANMLAAPFIRRSDPETLLGHFLAASPRLLASFARRLGQLHNEPAAIRLAQKLLGQDGLLGEPAMLDDVLRRGFIQLAPGAPEAALTAFERSLAGPNREHLLDSRAEGRYEYPELLVHLAHEPALFTRAMEVLLAFALADGDARDDRKATKHFLERFWPVLSFTLADQATRLDFIDRLLDDPGQQVRALGLEALDHMLEADNFSSSLNLEFGAKARLTEWRPGNGEGYAAWFGAAYERATLIACASGPEAERARDIIASHFRDHLDVGLPELPIAAMRAVRGEGYWEVGWRAVTEGLSFSGKALADNMLAEVRALEQELRPHSLDECFDAFVIGEPWRHWHPTRTEEHPTRDVGKLSEAIGICFARSGADPLPYFARAIAAEGQNSSWVFARGLTRANAEPAEVWQKACATFAATDTARRNPSVLAGVIAGAARRDRVSVEAWLDAAVTDPLLAEHLVVLQLAVSLDATAMARFGRGLAHGAVPTWRFANLQYGGVTKPIPGTALAEFLGKLYETEGGVLPALQILHMRLFGDRGDKRDVDPALVVLGRKFLGDARTYVEENEKEDHGIASIAKATLTGAGAVEAAVATCQALRGELSSDSYHSREYDTLCGVLMKSFPRVVLDEIIAHDVRRGLAARFFGGRVRNDDDDIDQSKITFDEAVALEWALEAPADRAPMLAELIPYSRKDEKSGLLEWSSFALALIDAAPDPLPVLANFEQRFFTGSGSGPFSARFVRRRPLVAAMRTHHDVRVRNWARAAGQALEESIVRWDERDRERESRFE